MASVDPVELHRTAFVGNLHDDWSLEIHREVLAGQPGALDRIYAPKMRQGGIDFTFYTVGGDDIMFTGEPDLVKGTLRAIDVALLEIERSEHFTLCSTADEVRTARDQGRIALMFTIEGAAPLDEDLASLRNLHRLGLKSVIATWFKANAVADGVGERRNGGLSNFGRDVIAEMGRLGMLVDISQASPRSVDDILAEATGPVIASHSNCSGQYSHPRNLTDDQLKGLAATGGLIGITCFPAHVGERPSFDGFLDHIEYAVGTVGPEHVAIGLNIVVHRDDEAKDFYERSAIDYAGLALPGLEDLPQFPSITRGLVDRGLDTAAIEGVIGENILRVVAQADLSTGSR